MNQEQTLKLTVPESASTLQQKSILKGKLDEEDIEFLEHWLTEHILVADLRLGTFLVDAM